MIRIRSSDSDHQNHGARRHPTLSGSRRTPSSATYTGVIHIAGGTTYLWSKDHKFLFYRQSTKIKGHGLLRLLEWAAVELSGKEVVKADTVRRPDGIVLTLSDGQVNAACSAVVEHTDPKHGTMLLGDVLGKIRLVGEQLESGAQVHCSKIWLDKMLLSNPEQYVKHTSPKPWLTKAEFVAPLAANEGAGAQAAVVCRQLSAASSNGNQPVGAPSAKQQISSPDATEKTTAVVFGETPDEWLLWSKLKKQLRCNKADKIKGAALLKLGEWAAVEIQGRQVIQADTVKRPAEVKIFRDGHGKVRAAGEAKVLNAGPNGAMLMNEAIGVVRLKPHQLKKDQSVKFEAWIDPNFLSHPKADTPDAKPWITNMASVSVLSPADGASASLLKKVTSVAQNEPNTRLRAIVVLAGATEGFIWTSRHKLTKFMLGAGLRGQEFLIVGNWVLVTMQNETVTAVESDSAPTGIVTSVDPLCIRCYAIVQTINANRSSILWHSFLGQIDLLNNQLPIGAIVRVEAFVDPRFHLQPSETHGRFWTTSTAQLADDAAYTALGVIEVTGVLMPKEGAAPASQKLKCIETGQYISCQPTFFGPTSAVGSKWRSLITAAASVEAVLAQQIGAPLLIEANAMVVHVDQAGGAAYLWQRDAGLLKCALNDSVFGYKRALNKGHILKAEFTTFALDGIREVRALNRSTQDSGIDVDASNALTVTGESLVQCLSGGDARIWSPVLGSMTVYDPASLTQVKKNTVVCFKAQLVAGFTLNPAAYSASTIWTAWVVDSAPECTVSGSFEQFCGTHDVIRCETMLRQCNDTKCQLQVVKSDIVVSCDASLYEHQVTTGLECTVFAVNGLFGPVAVSASASNGLEALSRFMSEPGTGGECSDQLLSGVMFVTMTTALVAAASTMDDCVTVWHRDLGLVKLEHTQAVVSAGQWVTLKVIASDFQQPTTFDITDEPEAEQKRDAAVKLAGNILTASGKALICQATSSGGLKLWNADIGDIEFRGKAPNNCMPGKVCEFKASLRLDGSGSAWFAEMVTLVKKTSVELFLKSDVISSKGTLFHEDDKSWLKESHTNERLSCANPLYYQAETPLRPGTEYEMHSVTGVNGRRKLLCFQ